MHNVLFTSSPRHFPHNLCYNPSHGFCADPLDYAPLDRTRYHVSGVTLNPLATYLCELRDIRSSGANVPETSFYGPLANLLNDVGRMLKPRVRCIINPTPAGIGTPLKRHHGRAESLLLAWYGLQCLAQPMTAGDRR